MTHRVVKGRGGYSGWKRKDGGLKHVTGWVIGGLLLVVEKKKVGQIGCGWISESSARCLWQVGPSY